MGIPRPLYGASTWPTLNHSKPGPYTDFPVIYKSITYYEPFYVEHDWTFATSDFANTVVYKWNGNGWTTVTGWTNPEHFTGRGIFAVSTLSTASVTVTEHVNS